MQSLIHLAKSAFSWASDTASFILKGRRIPPRTIETLNGGWMDMQKEQLIDLGDRLSNNRINLQQFQRQAGRIVSDINSASFALGAGGWRHITREGRDKLEGLIRAQLHDGRDSRTNQRYGLQNLAQEIKDGSVSAAQLQNRLSMYAESGKRAYFEGQRLAHQNSSAPYGYRVLGVGEHCQQCPEYASRPPQRADQLIMPTERCDCRNRCFCRIVWLSLEEAVKKGMNSGRLLE